jgi:hypothetical protein
MLPSRKKLARVGPALIAIVFGAVAAVTLLATAAQAASQTITFSSIFDKTFGAAPFGIAPTGGGSGNPVTLSTTTPGVCSVTTPSPATVTIITAGSCSITANQAGGGGFDPASPMIRTFNIAKANQTITATLVPTHTFGNAPFVFTATASSGLPVTIGATGSCSLSGSSSPATVTINAAGSCAITSTQVGGPNYNAATAVVRNFLINKASQSISLIGVPTTLPYGSAAFPVTATSTSGLAVTLAVTSGPCQVVTLPSDPSIKINGAGSCWIQASRAADTNYNAAFPQIKVVSITRAPLTVTADSPPDKVYGAPLPPIGSTIPGITGFVNGDTISNLSGTLSCFAFASASSPPGTYQTSCSGLSSPNYNITYVNGSLTVTKGPQTISIDAVTPKTYGASSFSVTTHSSSSLLVTLSSDTPLVCSVSATWFGPVTILHAGTCTLRAKQAGNSTYLAAPDATRDITVNPAPLSITAANKTMLTTDSVLPAFTLTYAGFVNGDTALTAVVTTPITCNAYSQAIPVIGTDTPKTAPLLAGTYTIACSGDLADYAETFHNGTLTVN